MQRLLMIVLVMVIVGIGLVGQRWYTYITNTDSPFEEVGMEINNRLPGPLHDYGCARLKATFGGKTLPVHGCQDATGKGWQ
jgi:hypothetical protein